ncbi:MAG: hypothetical protein WCD18_24715 [Thermosynechococcaceae cyanobacterium]
MIEVCPRCYSRLGTPLKSGRQVCPNCGWSTNPGGVKAPPPPAKRSTFMDIVNLCGKILQRSLSYVVQLVQDKWQQFRAKPTQPAPKGKRLVEGLSDRLSALEQAIPKAPGDAPRWMSLEEAFRYLGGDPKNSDSTVTSVSGATSIPFRHFRILKSEADFRAFGLEVDFSRREANKPWIRWAETV